MVLPRLVLVLLLGLVVAGPAGAGTITLTDQDLFTADDVIDLEDGSSDYVDHGRGDVNELSTNASQAAAGDFDTVTWTQDFVLDPDLEIASATLTLFGEDDGDPAPEFGFLEIEGEFAAATEVDDGAYEVVLDPDELLDGLLTVTVGSAFGDFTLTASLLTITYAAVPLPATLSLMLVPGLLLASLIRRQG